MRIAICGSACQGKSTLINDIINNWPMYKKSDESYRQVIKEEKLKINKGVNQEGQWKILNCLINDVQKTSKGEKILFDRCPLDNLVYSLWSNGKGSSDIDDEFIKKCIPLVKESMKFIDIIFFIPITKAAPVKLEKKATREIDRLFIEEIDNIFKAISYQANQNKSPFFDPADRPPIIEIFGKPEERIQMIKFYLGQDGDLIDSDESVLSFENLSEMQSLLETQQNISNEEKQEKKIKEQIMVNNKYLRDKI
jgi:predicted ATPase